MALFDAYVMVDWSGASTPRRGKDSIWYSVLLRDGSKTRHTALENPSTRHQATEELCDRLAALIADGRRVLAGFDFPFGYPCGTSDRLGITGLRWRHLWQLLDDGLTDATDNANNRFDLAESLNQRISGSAFPFWGNVREETRPYLVRRHRRPHEAADPAERRICDLRLPSTQPVWKLAGVGSVGSQALTGIPRVWQIRRDPRLATVTHIWPFETGLRFDPRPRLYLAEIYPSQIPVPALADLPKDAAQVTAITGHLARLDAEDRMETTLAGDPDLTAAERDCVETEEAWILGALGP